MYANMDNLAMPTQTIKDDYVAPLKWNPGNKPDNVYVQFAL